MGIAFASLLLRAGAPPDHAAHPLAARWARIVVRTGRCWPASWSPAPCCARVGAATLAAHQIAFQLFVFLALVLDAIAIAGQVLVGRALGAGDADGARAAARRMIGLVARGGAGLGGVLLALAGVLPRAFTGDPAVLDRRATLWPLFALMQPAAAVVFALDGILIGAGDTRYLAAAMVVASSSSCPSCWRRHVAGVWAALDGLMVARLATIGGRFAGGAGRSSGRRA